MIKITRYGPLILINEKCKAGDRGAFKGSCFINSDLLEAAVYDEHSGRITFTLTTGDSYASSPFRNKNEAFLWLSRILKNGGPK